MVTSKEPDKNKPRFKSVTEQQDYFRKKDWTIAGLAIAGFLGAAGLLSYGVIKFSENQGIERRKQAYADARESIIEIDRRSQERWEDNKEEYAKKNKAFKDLQQKVFAEMAIRERNEKYGKSLESWLQKDYTGAKVHSVDITNPSARDAEARLSAHSQTQVGGWREATVTIDNTILMYERLTVYDATRDGVGGALLKYCKNEPANEQDTLAGIIRYPELKRNLEFENGELYGFEIDGTMILIKPGMVAVPDPEAKGMLRKQLTDKELTAYEKGLPWAEEELRKFKEGFDLKTFRSKMNELMTPGALQ